jgi:hypothetical protein
MRVIGALAFAASCSAGISLSLDWRDVVPFGSGSVVALNGLDVLANHTNERVAGLGALAIALVAAAWFLLVPAGLYDEPVTFLSSIAEVVCGIAIAYVGFSLVGNVSPSGEAQASHSGYYVWAASGITIAIAGVLHVVYPEILAWEARVLRASHDDPDS